MTEYDVILKPMVTEKSNHLAGKSRDRVRGGKYSFFVHPKATKTQIKAAVEKIYNVKVKDVNTQVRPGKARVFRGQASQFSDTKRAIVTLKADFAIDLF